MLLANKRSIKQYDDVRQVCISSSGDEVFCVTDPPKDCPPDRRCKNPAQLLTAADWHSITKKYRLGNKAIRQLKRFWAMGETNFVTQNARLEWAFQELEDIMVSRLKRVVHAKPGVKYLPFHSCEKNNNSVNNHLIVGTTGVGKTTFASKLLTTENSDGQCWAKDRPIICFAMHPDPSLEPARQKYKKNWIDISYQRLDGDLNLSVIPPGALVVIDDVLEMLHDFRAKLIYNLVTEISTTGRHRKAKNGRGVEALVITHHYASRRQLGTARRAARFLTLFPQGSRLQTQHILKTRLGYTKTQIAALMKKCAGSRTMTIDLHHPRKIISENHVSLVE